MSPTSRIRTLRSAVALLALQSLAVLGPPHAIAALSDPLHSYFVPQAGAIATPSEGTAATRFFRACPDNDGGSSLPNMVRIKVVLHNSSDLPVVGLPATSICIAFNGGTPAQGFTGPGADSIIANSAYNPTLACPDVRCIFADGPTDASGTTYIFLSGFGGVPDQNRRWGHYDSEMPVLAEGAPLKGRLTTTSGDGSYTLQIRNVDSVSGLTTTLDQGERVTVVDWNPVAFAVGSPATGINYWRDFDGNGVIGVTDLNVVTAHLGHTCRSPMP